MQWIVELKLSKHDKVPFDFGLVVGSGWCYLRESIFRHETRGHRNARTIPIPKYLLRMYLGRSSHLYFLGKVPSRYNRWLTPAGTDSTLATAMHQIPR